MNRDAQLGFLKSNVGFREGLNNANPFTVWMTDGAIQGEAWCDDSAQNGAVGAGNYRWQPTCQRGVKGDSYTPWTVQHAKENGTWHEGPHPAPLPGWQYLCDWNHNGVADHIGTLWHDNGDGTRVGLEGNYHDQLLYVTRDDKYILGWVMLPIDAAPAPPPAPPTGHPYPGHTLQRGSREEAVRWLQHALNDPAKVGGNGYHLAEDADFGLLTHNAVRDYQNRHGLAVDAVVGPATWNALRP